jgi:hypothetical protein
MFPVYTVYHLFTNVYIFKADPVKF